MAREMALTAAHVARVPPFDGGTGRLEGRDDLPAEAEWEAVADALLAEAPEDGAVRIFAYGSLIWNPGFEVAGEELGLVRGWRRSFCLGWVRIYRGTPERPGIMLALDRGGACKGVVLRLPRKAARENLMKVIRRELPIRWEEHSIRWMRVETADGPIRAIGFPASRKSSIYLQGLDTDTVVEALATAAGERGSMAEYLRNTILQLEARGVHDAYLWRMQALVAVRIEALWGAP